VACDSFQRRTKPRFVDLAAVTLNLHPSPVVRRARNTSFEELPGLLRADRGAGQGGNDVLMVETIFDTLNARAALFAIDSTSTAR
jgi:5-methyltetrahydrofolate--homocysteine methyltransferase